MMKNHIKTVIRCFASIAIYAITVGAAAMAADTGAVYTSTNNPAGTAVVVFARAADGTLTLSGTFPTGGTSIGAFGTGDQHGLLLNGDGSCLWAVNSLSNQVSAFQVEKDGTSLKLVDIVASGGQRPVSVAVDQAVGLAYVLNAGGQVGSRDNLSGFTVGSDCRLSPLAHSTRALSGPNVSPAQVSFDPSGSVVVVTEKTANSVGISPPKRGGAVDTFIVNIDGRLGSFKSVSPPNPITEPFGFAFAGDNQLVVTAADCSVPAPPGVEPDCLVPPDHPALLSYTLSRDGTLTLIDKSVGDQAGTCWVATTTPGGRARHNQFAFTTNTLATPTGGTPDQPPAGSVTGYRVNRDGSLAELGVTPIPLMPDQFPDNSRPSPMGIPTDDALSSDNRFLYVLSEVDGAISAYKVGPDGGLTLLSPPTYLVTAASPFPNGPFATGLAAR